MNAYNPGNVLPFYANKAWQRHRQPGQDIIPFGLLAPRSRLLPFQIFVTGDAGTDTLVFQLISPTNDITWTDLNAAILTKTENAAETGYWITWFADEPLDVVPDCGFWYVRLTVEGVEYYSDVMYVTDICGVDDCFLSIVPDTCAILEGTLSFDFQATVFAVAGYTYSLQRYVGGWNDISSDETYTMSVDVFNELEQISIQVHTVCGLTMTRTYNLEWESGDACNTLTLTLVSQSNNAGLSVGNNPAWRLLMTNTNDKGNVLYQEGYTQHLYISPIWDVPEVNREVQTEVNGNGDITRRFTRTVERQKFEFPDMPDYVLGFLAKVGDLDSVILEEAETGRTITMENVAFESRRQGALLNIGIITFDAEIESFSGCQEDFELA